MGDLKTTAYQATMTYQYGHGPEQNTNIYSELPDQFTEYENKTYNPIDFYTSSGEFNLSLFNRTYREEQLKRIQFFRDQELKRLRQEDADTKSKPNLLDLTLKQHLTNFKDTFFGIWHDLQTQPLTTKIFTKNNRLFYIGVLLVLIFIIYLVLYSFVSIGTSGRKKSKQK